MQLADAQLENFACLLQRLHLISCSSGAPSSLRFIFAKGTWPQTCISVDGKVLQLYFPRPLATLPGSVRLLLLVGSTVHQETWEIWEIWAPRETRETRGRRSGCLLWLWLAWAARNLIGDVVSGLPRRSAWHQGLSGVDGSRQLSGCCGRRTGINEWEAFGRALGHWPRPLSGSKRCTGGPYTACSPTKAGASCTSAGPDILAAELASA